MTIQAASQPALVPHRKLGSVASFNEQTSLLGSNDLSSQVELPVMGIFAQQSSSRNDLGPSERGSLERQDSQQEVTFKLLRRIYEKKKTVGLRRSYRKLLHSSEHKLNLSSDDEENEV